MAEPEFELLVKPEITLAVKVGVPLAAWIPQILDAPGVEGFNVKFVSVSFEQVTVPLETRIPIILALALEVKLRLFILLLEHVTVPLAI